MRRSVGKLPVVHATTPLTYKYADDRGQVFTPRRSFSTAPAKKSLSILQVKFLNAWGSKFIHFRFTVVLCAHEFPVWDTVHPLLPPRPLPSLPSCGLIGYGGFMCWKFRSLCWSSTAWLSTSFARALPLGVQVLRGESIPLSSLN